MGELCLLRRLHTLFRPERREPRGTVAAGNGGCFPRCSPRWGMSLRSIPHRSPRGTVQPAASVATVSRDLSRLSESGCASSRDHATKTQATGQGGTRVRIRHQPFARRYDPPTRRARFRGVGPPRIEPNHPGALLPIAPWFCAWTRRARSRHWSGANPCFSSVWVTWKM